MRQDAYEGSIHATAVVIGSDGILIRGEAGAGKSSLARELIDWAQDAGRHAALVADDRVALSEAHGRAVARPVETLAGLLEIRGVGLVRVPNEPAAVLRLVVDLAEDAPRLPHRSALMTAVARVHLPRIVVNRALAKGVVVWRLGNLHDRFVTVP